MLKIKRLPDAELEIMNALWDADAPLTAAELETALPFRRQPPQLCSRPCRNRHPHRRRHRRAGGILGGIEKRKKIA